jgi:glycosyltransferase involved in cell wall biosynthesis
MKVMTAMYTMKRGGSYERFIMMIEAFLERECEVHCISLSPIQIRHQHFHNHKIYFPINKLNGIIAKLIILSMFPIWSIIICWKQKIDLIIAFSPLYAFIQSFAKLLLKKSMITLVRGKYSFCLQMENSSKWILYGNKLMENIALLFSDRLITNNLQAKNEILKRLEKKNSDVQVLYNNIPLPNKFEPIDILNIRKKYDIPKYAKIIMTACIINRGKNIEILIKCLPKIGMDNIFVVVVGDVSTNSDHHYKDSLKKLASKLGVNQRVIFTGWLEKEELYKIYLSSNIFIISSLSEGMPNALLEALGLGLPCLGSKIPGVIDILHYEELLFDPFDEEALAKKIQSLLSDNKYFQEIKFLCEKRKKKFTFDWKEKVFQIVTKDISLLKVN